MNVICVIQSRLGSTRLPGKVLLPLGGKPMLTNIIERIKRCKKIDEIVVAWPFCDFPEASKHKFDAEQYFYSGDENDLIGRFLACAREYKADWIVRVCSDNPVVEAKEIDTLVAWKETYPALLMTSENPERDHDGFGGEIYSAKDLVWMDRTIKDGNYREHLHKFWIDLEDYHYIGQQYPRGFRLDVNDKKDYEKLCDIYNHFSHNQFSAREALKYLEQKHASDLEKWNIPAGIRSNG